MPSDMAPIDQDALLDELRRSWAAVDPIPEPVQVAARAAIQWRALDAELAALVTGSRPDAPDPAAARARPRPLPFQAPEPAIDPGRRRPRAQRTACLIARPEQP
jgi:hypothetical protein